MLVGAISKSSVISFEPDSDTFLKPKRNIHLNKLRKNIRIHNLGLGDKEQKVSFKSMRNNGHNYILNSEVGDKKVKIIPLEKIKLETIPSLIKIDVEGYEDRALKPFFEAAPETLFPKNIVIEYTSQHEWEDKDFINYLMKKGYRLKMRTRGNLCLSLHTNNPQ